MGGVTAQAGFFNPALTMSLVTVETAGDKRVTGMTFAAAQIIGMRC